MARTDTDLLQSPSIDAMLAEARREAERAQAIQNESRQLAALTHCPSCRCRLSAIDAKMGNCLACGKPLTASPARAQSAEEPRAQFIVRI